MHKQIEHILMLLAAGGDNHTLALELMRSQDLQKPVVEALFPSKNFVLVEGGRFVMARAQNLDGSPLLRHATVSSFYIQNTPVTQQQYRLIMGINPSSFAKEEGNEERPAQEISWYNAIEFCNCLSLLSGRTPAYHIDKNNLDINNKSPYDLMKWSVACDWTANGYRLPTEAEWTFAAKGGNKSQGFIYSGSNEVDEVAWHKDNASGQSQPVKGKKPNELGLFDMSGNIWEWCWDWFAKVEFTDVINPVGPDSGMTRTTKGGAWLSTKLEQMEVEYRGNYIPSYRNYGVGFRLVLGGNDIA